MRYRFGKFQLDVERYELARAGVKLAVRPKVFDILRYLMEHPDRLVTKQELLDALWTDQHVNETSVPWTIGHARRLIGQRSSDTSPIETVHGRGYRWRGAIEIDSGAETSADAKVESSGQPFVGRAPLLATLGARLREVQAGRGGLCLLLGDAGIGKTRCIDELVEVARSLGFAVWSGPSAQPTATPVYFPWIQLLRRAAPERTDAAVLLSRLQEGGAHDGLIADRDAMLGRLSLFEAVSELLIESGRSTPLLLVLDDLHWADAGTIELLAFVSAQLRHARVLILAAAREPLALPGTKESSEPMRHAERYDIEPLDLDSVAQYLRAVTGAESPERALCEAVHRATAGYPLFLQETLSGLIAQHGRTALTSLPVSSIHPSAHARDSLRGRYFKLDDSTRQVLACASVLGEHFEVTDLLRLADAPLEILLDALDEASERGFILPDGVHSYAFRHALFREVVYEQVASLERLRLHRAAGRMRQSATDAPQRRSEIAYHLYRSLALGEYAEVRLGTLAAARAAVHAQSFVDAAQFYGWTLEVLALDPSASSREYVEVLLQQAQAQRCGGSPDDARVTLERLINAAAEHGYGDLLVHAARALRLSHAMATVPDPLARFALERALATLPEDASALRLQAQSLLAWLPPDAHDMQRSKAASEQALALARSSGSREALAEALTARLHALSGPDDIDALLATSDEMLALDTEPRGWISVEAYTARHCAMLHRGDLLAADAAIDAHTTLANARGFLELRWHLERHRAQRRFQQGDHAGAKNEFKRLEAVAVSMRLKSGAAVGGLHRALMTIATRGPSAFKPGEHEAFYREQLQMLQGSASLRATLGRLALKFSKPELARPILDELSANDFASVPKDFCYLYTLCNLATIAIELGERTRAQRLFALLEPYSALNTPNTFAFYEGPVAHFLALLAAFLGLEGPAEDYFTQALQITERLGLRALLARSCIEYARWLTKSKRGKQAAPLKARAIEISEQIGMHWLAECARSIASS